MASQKLWDCETPALHQEFKRCKKKLWQMRKDIVLNIPSLWLLAGMAGSVWMLLTGTLFQMVGLVWLVAWMVGAMLAPMLWLTAIRQRKGKMVVYYRTRIEIIDSILQDRS
ncbi:hypothetical protein [Pandoraea norimbergensis]|nr:hypothetical protein [Pandoraea norimbergensis]